MGDPRLARVPIAFRKHVRVRIQRRHPRELAGESERERAGTASDVEQMTASIEPQLPDQRGRQGRRIRGPPAPVVAGRAQVEGRIVGTARHLDRWGA
jgi:hypothetical protein